LTTTAVLRARRADLRPIVGPLGLAAGAWALTADRMSGMDAGPGTELGGLGWFAVTWLVMTAAMMLPALTPMVLAYGRRARSAARSVMFGAGYLAAWLVAGLVAYGVFEAARALDLGFLAWDDAGRYVAAAVVIAAGLYQLTARKGSFLLRCRRHSAFVACRWHAGQVGALRMGLAHGADCVGASWGLMAALFALGVMSLTWMALVAALIAAERLLPETARWGAALVLVALGTAVAVAPGDVPGLTVPGTAQMDMHMQIQKP
jgi:predicted metal-binding membrane protein